MPRTASDSGGGDFQPAPEGTHVARCIELIDIGTHHGDYLGTPTVRNQLIVRWEIPAETIDIEGRAEPMLVSKFYTNSLSEKANLRKDLVAWRGREFTPEELLGFDLQNILGKACLLTVVHTDQRKAKVTAVSGLAKGMTCPPARNPVKAFWIEDWDGNQDEPTFAALPKGFKALILESDEYAKMTKGNGASPQARHVDKLDDDIPFLLNECLYDVSCRFDRRMARASGQTVQRVRRDKVE